MKREPKKLRLSRYGTGVKRHRRGFQDFIKAGIKEETVSFIKLQIRIAYTHLAYYLGAKVLDKFVSDITETPLDEFFHEREYEYYN